jgi:ribulose-5-phosphate 4-epimerase/fuculose-1-phosphate aldolase
MYDAGLIGFDKKLNVGYGNISIRHPENPAQFIISGTQTGHFADLTSEDYTLVTAYDIPANHLHCKGPIKASSESLTHAAVYELNPAFQAVIHIHSLPMWEKLLHQAPTTSVDVPYGTPEMAFEVARLYRETTLPEEKLFAMAGHQDGLVAFGESLEEAGGRLEKRFVSS